MDGLPKEEMLLLGKWNGVRSKEVTAEKQLTKKLASGGKAASADGTCVLCSHLSCLGPSCYGLMMDRTRPLS